ncbi:glycosyltransferase [Candidatus Peregrinibacteria bacterium]|nr:glycosyltransferase [Candidatus Peregrinibacteria bacterium]
MKKILFYTDTEIFGGAEIQMLLLAKYLSKDFAINIVLRNSSQLKKLTKELESLKNCKIQIINSKSKNSWKNLIALNQTIKKFKPDIIHAHLWNPMACKHVYLAATANRTPLITTEHDPFKLNFIKRIYKKIVLKFVDNIIAISDANKKLISELYPQHSNKIITVHNGIELNNNKTKPKKNNDYIHHVFKSTKTHKIILSVAALHPRKGLKYLIGAYSKIVKKFPKTRLIIAGNGPQKMELEKLIKNLNIDDKVFLLGQRDDISDIMKSADIFVLPSLAEAFGLVILEAMREGLPIIATNSGGIPEILADNNGILVKPKDKQSLQKTITKLLQNDTIREQYAKKSLVRVKNFSAENTAKKTANIYKEIINKNGKN